jgi:hypothetical protein
MMTEKPNRVEEGKHLWALIGKSESALALNVFFDERVKARFDALRYFMSLVQDDIEIMVTAWEAEEAEAKA